MALHATSCPFLLLVGLTLSLPSVSYEDTCHWIWAHLGNVPHLQILNLISSAKAISANKVTVTGARDLTGTRLLGDQPTPASLSQKQPQHHACIFPKTAHSASRPAGLHAPACPPESRAWASLMRHASHITMAGLA